MRLPSLVEQWTRGEDLQLWYQFISPASQKLPERHLLLQRPEIQPPASAAAESQSQSHISWRDGDAGASTLWQNYCSFHLSIFIIVQFPTAASLWRAWFMTRSPSASSERRRVHHGDFSQASVLFNPDAGVEKKKSEGGRRRGGDGWRVEEKAKWGEWSGLNGKGEKSTYLYIKEVTLPCKFAKAHL